MNAIWARPQMARYRRDTPRPVFNLTLIYAVVYALMN
jgi:hypothetical protein